MVENGETQYALVDFEDYSSLFYTIQQGWLMPGGTEAIIRSPTYGQTHTETDELLPTLTNGGRRRNCSAPAANYVNYYGMANGLLSG